MRIKTRNPKALLWKLTQENNKKKMLWKKTKISCSLWKDIISYLVIMKIPWIMQKESFFRKTNASTLTPIVTCYEYEKCHTPILALKFSSHQSLVCILSSLTFISFIHDHIYYFIFIFIYHIYLHFSRSKFTFIFASFTLKKKRKSINIEGILHNHSYCNYVIHSFTCITLKHHRMNTWSF